MTAIEFAIGMELEGEQYYLEQVEKTQHAALKTVFTLLAAEEREHANVLESYAAHTSYELRQSQVPEHFESVFQAEQDLRVDFKARPEQLDAYELALEKEKDSIALYDK
ncbi:MAG: rubrerythrin, partial [Limnochordia bacterium]|nr:rubrerythrin [Limnochordia bacterium]